MIFVMDSIVLSILTQMRRGLLCPYAYTPHEACVRSRWKTRKGHAPDCTYRVAKKIAKQGKEVHWEYCRNFIRGSIGVARVCTGCMCTPRAEKKNWGPNLQGKVISAPLQAECTPRGRASLIFEKIGEICMVEEVILVVLALALRATTKKGRQLFGERKVHPQTKSWLRLWEAEGLSHALIPGNPVNYVTVIFLLTCRHPKRTISNQKEIRKRTFFMRAFTALSERVANWWHGVTLRAAIRVPQHGVTASVTKSIAAGRSPASERSVGWYGGRRSTPRRRRSGRNLAWNYGAAHLLSSRLASSIHSRRVIQLLLLDQAVWTAIGRCLWWSSACQKKQDDVSLWCGTS